MECQNKTLLICICLLLLLFLFWGTSHKSISDHDYSISGHNFNYLSLLEDWADSLSKQQCNQKDSIIFTSILFIYKDNIDSVYITYCPLQYSPDYVFWGFRNQNNRILVLGSMKSWGRHIDSIHTMVLNQDGFNTNEEEYYTICDRLMDGDANCAPIFFYRYIIDDSFPSTENH